jgi:hypothetical protein
MAVYGTSRSRRIAPFSKSLTTREDRYQEPGDGAPDICKAERKWVPASAALVP